MPYRDVENATVGQLQSTAGTQFSKSQWLPVVVRRDRDSGGVDVIAHRCTPSYPDAPDQHFRHCDRMHEHLPGCTGEKNFGGCSMMRIGWIQMGDEHTRIHGNHAGQSALRSAR